MSVAAVHVAKPVLLPRAATHGVSFDETIGAAASTWIVTTEAPLAAERHDVRLQ
jgi:hypothetical protein